jgi:hypothetical protein
MVGFRGILRTIRVRNGEGLEPLIRTSHVAAGLIIATDGAAGVEEYRTCARRTARLIPRLW